MSLRVLKKLKPDEDSFLQKEIEDDDEQIFQTNRQITVYNALIDQISSESDSTHSSSNESNSNGSNVPCSDDTFNAERPQRRQVRTKYKSKTYLKPLRRKPSYDELELTDEFLLNGAKLSTDTHTPCFMVPNIKDCRTLHIESKYLRYTKLPDGKIRSTCSRREQKTQRRISHSALNQNRQRKPFRTIHLTTFKTCWPAMHKNGLKMSMTLDHTMNGTFMFEHDENYQNAQHRLLQTIRSANVDDIVSFVQHHPYHIDGLLQLAALCEIGGNTLSACDLIERALYCLECCLHPRFSLTSRASSLDFRRRENRAMFVCLFKYIKFVGEKQQYQSALELSKLLFSLEPDNDPLAVSLLLDLYAINAKRYRWFVEMVHEVDTFKHFLQLPNVAYSLALAHFHLGNHVHADRQLQNALLTYPTVLVQLMDKCSVEMDNKVRHHSFFQQTRQPPALEHLIEAYVRRGFSMWKNINILPWLERNAHAVIAKLDEDTDNSIKIAYKKQIHKYEGPLPHNVARHFLLWGYKDLTVDTAENDPYERIDPLPPSDSVSSYTTPSETIHQLDDSQNCSAVTLFFRSLWPTFTVKEQQSIDNTPPSSPACSIPRSHTSQTTSNTSVFGSLANVMQYFFNSPSTTE